MFSKLPPWVGICAFLLAFAGGCINVFLLIGPLDLPVSHLTGTSSAFAIGIAQANVSATFYSLMLLATFCAGAMLSGFIIRDSSLKLGRRYGFALLLETGAIGFAWLIFNQVPILSHLILSAACGLQNALATTYSGAVVRTTHLTGVFTDLGILIGNRLAGIQPPKKKVKLFAILISGFISGGIISGILYPVWGRNVLLISGSISFSLAAAYFIYRYFFKRFHHAQRLAEMQEEMQEKMQSERI